jgi:AcrR family transcriptional regulator
MARNRNMRKKPLQARSQVTVDAIVEAAARVFESSGFDGASTNKIAEIAGVSVGSLYQYFPDKLGLLQAVNERYLVRMWGAVSVACREALLASAIIPVPQRGGPPKGLPSASARHSRMQPRMASSA